MKRKRLILTTVLLVCVAAVVVPYRREIWIAVQYEEAETVNGVRYLKPRAWHSGFPGVLSQVCGPCRSDACVSCELGWKAAYPIAEGSGPGVYEPNDRIDEGVIVTPLTSAIVPAILRTLPRTKGNPHCTCPDPSHEWNR